MVCVPLIESTLMPEVFSLGGYAVYFSALDIEHGVHVHVRQGHNLDLARFVITSDGHALLSHNHGRLAKKTIRQLQFVIEQNTDEILRLWVNLFGDDIHFDK